MSDIFREVDEAMQQEKFVQIWQEYKSTIIASIAILILSSAATTFYRSWDVKRDTAETAKLMEAMNAQAPEAALAEVIGESRNGHEAIAFMNAAALHLEKGEDEKAVALYEQAINQGGLPRDFRDLARILYTRHADSPSLDILQPLLVNDKSPWRWQARIEAALITAHGDTPDYTKALEYLAPFEEATTLPLSLKQKAQSLSHLYAIKAAQQKPAPSAAE